MASLSKERPAAALGYTMAAQAAISVAQTMPAVLAPAIAPALGMATHRLGLFMGIVYACGMISGLGGSGTIARHGALRVTQLALLTMAAGLLLLASGSLVGAIAAALAIGTAYGLINPAASAVLGVHVPPNRRGLFFSLKQTGVPIGIAIAGLLGPWLYGRFGWPGALGGIAMLCGLIALALQPGVAAFDVRVPTPTVRTAWYFPLRTVLGDAALSRLGIVSLVYGATQVGLVSFMVSYLAATHHYPLALAAGVLSAAQVASVIGRPFWGWVADRYVAPATLLGLLGIASAVTIGAFALMPTSPPYPLALCLAIACAATAIAWNGVFFAELAHRVPVPQLGAVTGGIQFLTFLGGMSGPLLVGTIVGEAGRYRVALSTTAALTALAALAMLLDRSKRRA
ncbi:MAG: MFS transporter [Burkholderiaceae bacterium]